MDSPHFSVIIPVYNNAETLGRAIESVLKQDYPAHEIIVVDDGSTDDSAAVARRYGAPVKLVQQPNAGVSAARNLGAQTAESEWLAFLDADDWYYPARLGLYAALIRQMPQAGFLTGDFDYRDENNVRLGGSMEKTVLGRRLLEQCDDSRFSRMDADDFGDFIAAHFGDTHTLTLRRETFMQLGGYDTRYQVCEDVHFLVRLCAISHCAGVVCEPLAAYVIHQGSATRRDPVRAQQQTVAAMSALREELGVAPPALRSGIRRGLASARKDLAYSLLKTGARGAACAAVLPNLLTSPGWSSVRDIISVLRGLPKAS